MDKQCGGHTIPKLLKAHSAVISTDSIATFLPWWEWSTGTPTLPDSADLKTRA